MAVLIGGSDFRIYEVPADRELQDILVDAEAEFWGRVQRGEPPEPVTVDDMVARWGSASREGLVVATDEVQAALQQLAATRAHRERLEAAEDECRALVMRAMGERDTLVDAAGNTLATWRAAKPAQRFDTTAFRAAHADLYQRFLTAGEPARRFLSKVKATP